MLTLALLWLFRCDWLWVMVHAFPARVHVVGLASLGGPLAVFSLSAHLEAVLQLGSVRDCGCARVRSKTCTRTTGAQKSPEAFAAAQIAQILPGKRAALQASKTLAPT